MAILNNSNAISSGGYDINNSLRFRSSASAYLNRTPASAGNRKTWTWSAWVKRGSLGTSVMFSGGATSSDTGVNYIGFLSDQLIFAGISTYFRITSQVLRDPSAWYHIVVAFDSTQATANNRCLMYINGNVVTAFTTNNTLTLNTDYGINQAAAHRVASESLSGGFGNFDGYMTDINFIDGQALTPSSFGETDTTTGSWKPKAYTSTYGTNGFYLKFSDIATTSGSNAGLGKDFSGNANYWTTNNISVTAGTTYDAMSDVPTLTSATVANYAVMNPLYKDAGLGAATFSNANLKTTATSAGFAISTIGVTSGKWYWEFTADTVANSTENNVGVTAIPFGSGSNFRAYGANGQYFNGSSWASYGATYTNGDIIGVALDMDAQTLTFYKNNSSQGQKTSIGLTGLEIFSCCYENTTNASFSANFGQRPFSYTPPTGFVRLNTFNLPDSTIKKGNTVMDATIYSGNSTNNRSIVNEASFRPDFVWIKPRNNPDVHQLYDTIRGAGNNSELQSNSSAAEGGNNSEVYGYMSAFTSTGFTVAAGTDPSFPYALVNMTGRTYVGWQWQASSSTVTNTSGTISTQVRANTTAGFSVFTFTGTGASASIGHGLGVAPKFMLFKRRDATNDWNVLTNATGSNQYGFLNLTTAFASAGETWTSTIINIGGNFVNGGTYVCYAWAEIAGFSKFGSYVGNSNVNGPFIYLGFRPKYVLIKNITSYDWHVFDAARNAYNLTNSSLKPDTTGAEYTNDDVSVDFLSNGFKLRGTDNAINYNGDTHIYMAFAENPFKNALAR